MATNEDLIMFVPGQRVIISNCKGRDHIPTSSGCLCDLRGTEQVMGERYDTGFVGTATWHLKGTEKRAQLAEVTFLKPNPERGRQYG